MNINTTTINSLTPRAPPTEYDLRRAVVATLEVGVADRLAGVRGRPEVDDLDPVRLPDRVNQHDVLRLQVGVDQTQLL